jgi:hypothetical protein
LPDLRDLRARRFTTVDAGNNNFAHESAIWRAASCVAMVAWRLTMALLFPRMVDAMALAPLSHMLRKGLDFIHGFLIQCSE